MNPSSSLKIVQKLNNDDAIRSNAINLNDCLEIELNNNDVIKDKNLRKENEIDSIEQSSTTPSVLNTMNVPNGTDRIISNECYDLKNILNNNDDDDQCGSKIHRFDPLEQQHRQKQQSDDDDCDVDGHDGQGAEHSKTGTNLPANKNDKIFETQKLK